MKYSLLIINHINTKFTETCLNSIKNQVGDFEVVMIENGSREEERADGKGFARFKQVILNKNYGFPVGVNVGVKACVGEWVLVLNNDCELKDDFLEKMKRSIDSDFPSFARSYGMARRRNDKEYFIFSPKIYSHSAKALRDKQKKPVIYACGDCIDEKGLAHNIGRGEVDHGQYDKNTEVPLASFACILIKKEVLKKFPLDESFSPGYYEDVDFCLRVQKAGYKIAFVPQAVCWHMGEASFGKLNSIENEMRQFRNLSYVVAKHFSLANIVRHYLVFNLKSLRYYLLMKKRIEFFLIECQILKRFFCEKLQINF